jgi:hypothetical protein
MSKKERQGTGKGRKPNKNEDPIAAARAQYCEKIVSLLERLYAAGEFFRITCIPGKKRQWRLQLGQCKRDSDLFVTAGLDDALEEAVYHSQNRKFDG